MRHQLPIHPPRDAPTVSAIAVEGDPYWLRFAGMKGYMRTEFAILAAARNHSVRTGIRKFKLIARPPYVDRVKDVYHG